MRKRLLQWFDRPLISVIALVAGGGLGFASSFLAVQRAFGVRAVLGAAAGIGVVAIVWYWARLQRQLDELSLRQPALRERDQYESALARIANRGSRSVIHRSAVITYEMGVTPDLDRISEAYVTVAADLDRPILWHEVHVNPIGEEVPTLRSFRDLRHLRATQTDEFGVRGLQLLAAGHTGNGRRGLAIFDPEIGADACSWTWSCNWPVFNPLRRSRRDSIGIDVRAATIYEELRIHVVLPPTAIRPRMEPIEVANTYRPKLLQRAPGDERWRFEVVLRRPDPGYYSWTVTVEQPTAD